MCLTTSFAKGQLDPRLCRHRVVKKKKCTVFNVIRPFFLHDLVSVVAFILGETSAGPHTSILVDLLDCLQLEESSAVATEHVAYSLGLVTGLAR